MADTQAETEKVKCGCCGKEMPKDQDQFCHGCKNYICDSDCSASAPFGKHEPWQHKPCDTCGEPVAEKNLHLCSGCLEGRGDE